MLAFAFCLLFLSSASACESRQLLQSADPSVPCEPEDNIWRPGNTYNDPTQLITSTSVECCDLCRADDRCDTWSREKFSGACALKDANATAFLSDDYDSGFIGGADAVEAVPLPECFMEDRMTYPDGDVLQRMSAGSAEKCCEACLENEDYFSWYHDDRDQQCILNRNVPPAYRRGTHFTGAALV